MKTKHINWRKATKEELETGHPEMIKVLEEEIDVPDPQIQQADISNIDIDSLTHAQLMKLKQKLNSI